MEVLRATVHCHAQQPVSWQTATLHDALQEPGLRLFRVYLPAYEHLLPYLASILLPAELTRAQRYYQVNDQKKFIICRALLKILLSKSTQTEVTSIYLSYYSNKKPYLPSHPALCFNIAHAGNYAVLAIADYAIGVDIEQVKDNFSFWEILSHLFSPTEAALVRHAPDEAQAFYTLWTRKEALVKATGKGIDDNFARVPATDGRHPANPATLGSAGSWQVRSFAVAEDYVGAVAHADAAAGAGKLSLYELPTTLHELLAR